MPNQAIKCSVDTCKFNENTEFCSLKDIEVGNTVANPTKPGQTECSSFKS